ncbi:hypothetical protein SADUNF_Sadunf09G0086600 [Salix dunnii]|uniref:Uncharacterized protein n=1 Tax=Salix dunnii TaxID=1413687 RepID=A0A835JT13_9ROSI|nr:hypothetical protein SADUNF_Sadunf09G0086600 [Salix dunnii]
MVIQRLEMCIVLVKLAMEFIMAVAEAIGIFIQQNGTAAPLANRLYTAPVPFVGTVDMNKFLQCESTTRS